MCRCRNYATPACGKVNVQGGRTCALRVLELHWWRLRWREHLLAARAGGFFCRPRGGRQDSETEAEVEVKSEPKVEAVVDRGAPAIE